MSEAVTAQLERFAPGFRDVVVQTHVTTAAGLAATTGTTSAATSAPACMDVRGLFGGPWLPGALADAAAGVYLCSSSTPPGPGVTGMPGFHAAKHAFKDIFGLDVPALGYRVP